MHCRVTAQQSVLGDSLTVREHSAPTTPAGHEIPIPDVDKRGVDVSTKKVPWDTKKVPGGTKKCLGVPKKVLAVTKNVPADTQK